MTDEAEDRPDESNQATRGEEEHELERKSREWKILELTKLFGYGKYLSNVIERRDAGLEQPFVILLSKILALSATTLEMSKDEIDTMCSESDALADSLCDKAEIINQIASLIMSNPDNSKPN